MNNIEALDRFYNSKYTHLQVDCEKVQINGKWMELELRIHGTDRVILKQWVHEDGFVKKKERKNKVGGKRSYVKVYTSEVKKHLDSGIEPDAIGFALLLADNIEWSTCLLYQGRGKNKRYCTLQDICDITHNSLATTKRRIKALKGFGIIKKTPDGYQVNPDLIGRGV